MEDIKKAFEEWYKKRPLDLSEFQSKKSLEAAFTAGVEAAEKELLMKEMEVGAAFLIGADIAERIAEQQRK
jgi:hypothetical protein